MCAMWKPKPESRTDAAVAALKDHLAFYPGRVDAIEEQAGA
jgi:hypothetical protein